MLEEADDDPEDEAEPEEKEEAEELEADELDMLLEDALEDALEEGTELLSLPEAEVLPDASSGRSACGSELRGAFR